MTIQVVREHVPQTNGDPDKLIEETTEVLLVESEHGWRVLIEHFDCDNLIQIDCESHDDAVTLIDRIDAALASNARHLKINAGHLVSLDRFRQAWIDQSHGGPRTATSPQ